ncbi:MAG: 16S rRNA (guanine(966)-N(2))-methyltransferase RsmD [Candidatus Omnitrophota bacterium]|nr:16S rRNA (guanine(966)-N(2))-methyltransferase RsmD [Candidatus Omnitrophota bacterium]
MRITTGIYKGRNLGMPKGIRPTQNKTRKALFDILGNNVEGLSFLELFAGSGAVGFEALSRGAKVSVLVEEDPECVSAIKKNIELLKVFGSCILYPIDSQRAIKSLHQSGKSFDIIFLDPPYYQDLVKKTLQTLEAYDILSPNGLIIAQHFKKENLPDDLGVLSLFKQYKYGSTLLSLFRKGRLER